MRPLPYLRIPILNKRLTPMRQGESMAPPPLATIDFELVRLTDGMMFYECTRPSCRGAGCPAFSRIVREIPQFVMDHLYRHVENCEGVKR